MLDSATKQVLNELRNEDKKNREKLVANLMLELDELPTDPRPTIISEEEVRPELLNLLYKEPQNLCLNFVQTKKFLLAQEGFEVTKVSLRQRILKPGEMVNVYTDHKVYKAVVISTSQYEGKCNSESGLTNVTIKKVD